MAPKVAKNSEPPPTTDEVTQANTAQNAQTVRPSRTKRGQDKLEQVGDRVLAATTTGYGKFASDFASSNADSAASKAVIKEIHQQMSGFAESSKTLMKVLDEVQKLHPFIGVAVLAFKAVITLEMKRRDNDEKVIVLQLKMQELMEVFVQLRAVTPEQLSALDDEVNVHQRLKTLSDNIAKDIEACGNLCDVISKKRFIVRLFKGPIYEERLAEYMQIFDNRQKELELALVVFTAHGVHTANVTLLEMQEALKSTQRSVEAVLLFQSLQTPKERVLQGIIRDAGGSEKAAKDPEVLKKLLELSGVIPENQTTWTSTEGMDRSYRPSTTRVPPAQGHTPVYQVSPVVNPTSRYASPMYVSPANYMTPVGLATPHISVGPLPAASPWAQAPYQGYGGTPSGPGIPTYTSPGNYLATPGGYAAVPSRRSSYERAYVRRHSLNDGPAIPRPNSPERKGSRDSANGVYASRPELAPEALAALQEELSEDVEESLSKNWKTFSRKIHEQARQLRDVQLTVVRQGDRVVSAIREGPHDRVLNVELREIWKEMAWKLTVPAEEFVFTLRDWFMAQHRESEQIDSYFNQPPKRGASGADEVRALRELMSRVKEREGEFWAFKHLTVANVPALLEAFDGDMSGWVSVWEVNDVMSLKPLNWSLLQWLAYWAAGRHYTIWQYRLKICGILNNMHAMLPDILLHNQVYVDRYLRSLETLEAVLAFISPFTMKLDERLAERIEAYDTAEEQRMLRKLQGLNFEIDGVDALALVVGEHRIDRDFFPLMFLVMRSHLSLISMAKKRDLTEERFKTASLTVENALLAVTRRFGDLKVLMHQKAAFDPTIYLKSYAFGLYSAFTELDAFRISPYDITEEMLAGDFQGSVDEPIFSPTLMQEAPKGAAKDEPEYDDVAMIDACVSGTGIKGFWTGACAKAGGKGLIMIQFRITKWNPTSGQFAGFGSSPSGTLQVTGFMTAQFGEFEKLEISLSPPTDGEGLANSQAPFQLNGRMETLHFASTNFLPTQYALSGYWTMGDQLGNFRFTQTPAWVEHYRVAMKKDRHPNTSRARWTFALSSVMHQIRSSKGLLSWHAIRGTFLNLMAETRLVRRHLFCDTPSLSIDAQPPYQARLIKSLAVSSPVNCVHDGTECQGCHLVIVGPRFVCLDCRKRLEWYNLCETCAGIPNAHPGEHAFVRLHRLLHSRKVYFILDRAFSLLSLLGSQLETNSVGPRGSIHSTGSPAPPRWFTIPASAVSWDPHAAKARTSPPPGPHVRFSEPSTTSSLGPTPNPAVTSRSLHTCLGCGREEGPYHRYYRICMTCSKVEDDQLACFCNRCDRTTIKDHQWDHPMIILPPPSATSVSPHASAQRNWSTVPSMGYNDVRSDSPKPIRSDQPLFPPSSQPSPTYPLFPPLASPNLTEVDHPQNKRYGSRRTSSFPQGFVPHGQPTLPLSEPESFSRPANRMMPMAPFAPFKIHDLDGFLYSLPELPLVLATRDVNLLDWDRFMKDIGLAWTDRLGAGSFETSASKVTADIIDAWNSNFFDYRGVSFVLYKGKERRSGAGASAGIEDEFVTFDDTSSKSGSSSSDGDEQHAISLEAMQAIRRRRERKTRERVRERELKKARKELLMSRSFTLWLTCIQ